MVLLHAASASATRWFPNVEELSREYRVYAVDTIGDAGKGVISSPPETSADYVGWLTDVFDELEIEQANVIGASHGGWLTMHLAIHAPERVKKIVLLSPANALVPFDLMYGLRVIPSMLFPVRPLILNSVLPLFATPPNQIYLEQMIVSATLPRAMLWPKTFSDDELMQILTPALLLIGEQELIVSKLEEAVYRAIRLIPSVEVGIIPDASHLLSIDQPQIVNMRILEFLGAED